MSDSHDSSDFIKYLVNLFKIVGGVLVVGTVITVVIDIAFPLSLAWAAVIGLSIALVKASFVVAIFMHYKWDKKLIMITWTMLITFFFFAGMMGLIMWADGDTSNLARNQMPAIWVVLASLLGVLLPVSFTVLTVKLLSEPAPIEAAERKVGRPTKKKS